MAQGVKAAGGIKATTLLTLKQGGYPGGPGVLAGVLNSGRWSQRARGTAVWEEAAREGSQAEECGLAPEAGKGKAVDSPLEAP